MAEITATLVKDLRERTGAGMMDCKKALTETSGDFDQAIDYLRKKGIASASKKAGRLTKEGAVFSYIHGEGRVGVMVEINCETDFVARNEHFKALCKDIAMHIAASAPVYVSSLEVPPSVVEKEREIAIAQMQGQNKPANVIEKIAEGKVKKYFDDVCLLNQAFVKDPTKSIEDLIKESIAAMGENISIRRFSRFVLGEGLETASAE